MSKSSKFAHAPALGAHLPTSHPVELLADIEALETWRKSVEMRFALNEHDNHFIQAS